MKEPKTAPIGPKTVTVNGHDWTAHLPWDGFDFSRAISRPAVPGFPVALDVPWAHPEDRVRSKDHPDAFAVYRLRLKRGWHSFVQDESGMWMVSTAPIL